MKLLFICPDWFPYSAGLAQSALEITKGLKEQGHQIRIITAQDQGLDAKGMDVIGIKYLFRLLSRSPIIYNYWNKINKHISWADEICLFSYMYEMNSRIVIYKKIGLFDKPITHFYRGSLEREGTEFLSWPIRIAKEVWDQTLGRIMFTWTNKTISNSKPTIKYITKKYGISKDKLSYVPTGIETNKYKISTLNNKRIIFVGRLIENKGIKHFEEIVKAIPENWKFAIIGNGPLEKKVRELNKKYKQIEFVGKIPHEAVIDYLEKSDLLVLPSYAEGSPRAVIEASASGIPCIAFNVGDVSSFLPSNTRIPLGNIERFVARVEDLTHNPKKLKKIIPKKPTPLKETNKLIEKELESLQQ